MRATEDKARIISNPGARPVLSVSSVPRGTVTRDYPALEPKRDPRRGNLCMTIETGDEILVGGRLCLVTRILDKGKFLLRPK